MSLTIYVFTAFHNYFHLFLIFCECKNKYIRQYCFIDMEVNSSCIRRWCNRWGGITKCFLNAIYTMMMCIHYWVSFKQILMGALNKWIKLGGGVALKLIICQYDLASPLAIIYDWPLTTYAQAYTWINIWYFLYMPQSRQSCYIKKSCKYTNMCWTMEHYNKQINVLIIAAYSQIWY